MTISITVPAHNEAQRIGKVVKLAAQHADEVLVIDDGSTDDTADAAKEAGAQVIIQKHNGYIAAIKRGFYESRNNIVVTMDADGEHRAEDIPQLVAPILAGDADLVIGSRSSIDRTSERFINWLTNLRVNVKDCGSGFRAIRRDSALKLELHGKCTCGILVLEAASRGLRITEVPINLNVIPKKRRILWIHFMQVFYVIRWLIIKSAVHSQYER